MTILEEVEALKQELDVTIVAHFYQNDEVYACGDITGDSLELARKAKECKSEYIVFCGVGFMGESVKIIAPEKRVLMPKIACCSMAKMIDGDSYDKTIQKLESIGIKKDEILPITYINSSAEIKSKVGMMRGSVCTSSNAEKIIDRALVEGKRILFVPDRCLGQNIANQKKLSSSVIGIDNDEKLRNSKILCFDGFCSVHQLFDVEDIAFYREKYDDIQIIVHPECKPEVVEKADFVGSTSQIIQYVKSLPEEQIIAVGTEFNLVNRLREKNTYVLSSTKPSCPTMNETSLEDVANTLRSIKNGSPMNEVFVDATIAKWAKIALDRMLEVR